ncbi:MAG: hypothetical protein ACOX75_07690 [Lachnospiraceae bacterium]|jgi:hypothetical protein
MSSRELIRNQILLKAREADKMMKMILENPDLPKEMVCECVHKYVCSKFYLELEEAEGLTMSELAEKSIDKALDLGMPLAKENEMATTCGAAGDGPMKIALLLNTMKKDFQLTIEPRRLGMVADTKELGQLIYESRFQK